MKFLSVLFILFLSPTWANNFSVSLKEDISDATRVPGLQKITFTNGMVAPCHINGFARCYPAISLSDNVLIEKFRKYGTGSTNAAEYYSALIGGTPLNAAGLAGCVETRGEVSAWDNSLIETLYNSTRLKITCPVEASAPLQKPKKKKKSFWVQNRDWLVPVAALSIGLGVGLTAKVSSTEISLEVQDGPEAIKVSAGSADLTIDYSVDF
ncbi:MAG: hypothetical protein QM526_01600 [Alphaproteobacteria bacterium]|nr:hypothetical protein [Alphaproteobacteria bacterium]